MSVKVLPIILSVLLAVPMICNGQTGSDNTSQVVTNLKKNSVFGNVGLVIPVFAASASISYDRSIFLAKDESDIIAKVSVGFLGVIMAGQFNYQSLSIGVLTGQNSHHFELFAGAAVYQHHPPSTPDIHDTERISGGIFPVGNLGYRYQKPGGWFIFRAGIGFPDLAYIGFGLAF